VSLYIVIGETSSALHLRNMPQSLKHAVRQNSPSETASHDVMFPLLYDIANGGKMHLQVGRGAVDHDDLDFLICRDGHGTKEKVVLQPD
jgi:hypothetical protein